MFDDIHIYVAIGSAPHAAWWSSCPNYHRSRNPNFFTKLYKYYLHWNKKKHSPSDCAPKSPIQPSLARVGATKSSSSSTSRHRRLRVRPAGRPTPIRGDLPQLLTTAACCACAATMSMNPAACSHGGRGFGVRGWSLWADERHDPDHWCGRVAGVKFLMPVGGS